MAWRTPVPLPSRYSDRVPVTAGGKSKSQIPKPKKSGVPCGALKWASRPSPTRRGVPFRSGAARASASTRKEEVTNGQPETGEGRGRR